MTSTPGPLSSSSRLRRWLVTGIVFAVLASLVTGAVLFVLAAQSAMLAETHLHAMRYAILACHAYVEQNHGAWPSAWEDVEPLFPDDRDWRIRESVHIDFDADPAELALQDLGSFSGITVDDPVFPSYEGDLQALIELLRRHQE